MGMFWGFLKYSISTDSTLKILVNCLLNVPAKIAKKLKVSRSCSYDPCEIVCDSFKHNYYWIKISVKNSNILTLFWKRDAITFLLVKFIPTHLFELALFTILR